MQAPKLKPAGKRDSTLVLEDTGSLMGVTTIWNIGYILVIHENNLVMNI